MTRRALGHRPHHRQLAVGVDAGDLLRVERQVVAEHAGGLLGRDLGQHRDVVEDGGDVVDQHEQTGGHELPDCKGMLQGGASVYPCMAAYAS